MKKLLLLITYNVSLIAFCAAQNPLVKQWDYRFGGTLYDHLQFFQQTTDRGYILGGSSTSAMDGDKTQFSWGEYDYWIVKTDSLGLKLWDKRFGGSIIDELHSLQQTSDGGYILGGISNSPISGDKTESSWGGFDYWIVKTDSLGIIQWDKQFGGIYNDRLYSIQQTSDGGYILGGLSRSPISGDKTQPNWDTTNATNDYWIVKTDSSGTKQWDKRFGGILNDELFSLQQTIDGGYILGGVSYSGISGDKTEPNWDLTLITPDYWIIKIDSLGSTQWDKRFGGDYIETFISLKQTIDGGYILGGFSGSLVSGDKTQPSWGGFDYWILKADSTGNKEWDKRFGGYLDEDDFGTINQTSDGGYIIAGTSYSSVSGDKTENNLGGEQDWIVKTDSSGNKQWDKTIFTIGHDEYGYAIQTHDGCYAVANATAGGTGGYKTQPNWDTTNTAYDYWIVKFCDTTLTTFITQLPDYPNTFSIYPNPAKEVLVISDKALGKKEIEIYDLFGRRVLHSSFNIQHSSFTIDISKLSPGIYFLKAGNEVRKFVKE